MCGFLFCSNPIFMVERVQNISQFKTNKVMQELEEKPGVSSLTKEDHALRAISPIDGRYADKTEELKDYSSEFALMRYRLLVEVEYLKAVTKEVGIDLSKEEMVVLDKIVEDFPKDLSNGRRVKEIEKGTNHDVKAVEIFLQEKLLEHNFSDKIISHIHFGLTSQDIDNVARTLMCQDQFSALSQIVNKIYNSLEFFIKEFAELPMLARTHGQPATPTTFGKEIAVFVERIDSEVENFSDHDLSMKFGGATGNMNAHKVAYPHVDWLKFADEFVENITKDGESTNYRRRTTTQIDSYDSHAEFFAMLQRLNSILIDLCQDMWLYISNNLVIQKPKEGEVGSSTMPHKVNPIDFENAEGNLAFANAQLQFYQIRLTTSRMQRDLTDSTIVRNFGLTFGYCLIGYKSLLRGLGKISPNESFMKEELMNHPEVITEAIQTILRREGIPDAYNQLKEISRGKKMTIDMIHDFIDSLPVSDLIKAELKLITPGNYIGYSVEIAQSFTKV